jgi:ethanolamine utilization microcompartment shell protein EutL
MVQVLAELGVTEPKLQALVGEQLELLAGRDPGEVKASLEAVVRLLGCTPQQAVAAIVKQPNLLTR